MEKIDSGEAKQIGNDLGVDWNKDYHRLNPTILSADSGMDNASADNLLRLKEDALNYVSQSAVDQELDMIVEKLFQYS